jgi:hypothetical protein
MTIEEIVKNKKELIALKKTTIKHSDPSINIPLKELTANKEIKIDGYENLCKAIANTYYWMDSHDDVHVKGCFSQTIKQNLKSIFHLDNHNSENGFRSKVGNVKDVLEIEVPWSAFGIEKEGNTISVLGVSELIEEYNKQVFDAYKNGEVKQHSVGMIYVSIELAIKERNKDYSIENKAWDEVYPMLGNPEKADGRGYFWVIKEAKLKEYSCLLWDGSNILTPTAKDNNEPSKDTHKTEPSNDTQKQLTYLFI